MPQHPSRREFLKTATCAGLALGLASSPAGLLRRAHAAGARPLQILVLGGTGQTGPHLVRELLGRGHTVTLFNRGNRSAELFPDVECIVGDRALDDPDGLAALQRELAGGRTWDLCMDIWPHIPDMVENTAALLRGKVDRYLYVSSLSAYADHSRPDMDETAPVAEAPGTDWTEYQDHLFGPFKAECEKRVRRHFPQKHTIFRPGLIVGPRDFSFRGVYWPVRVRRGGEVLAPGDGFDRVQLIDARDLTAFQARCMEQGIGGTFNVVGPHPRTPLTMRRLLETCRQVSGSDARFVWTDAATLAEHQVTPWGDMPCWVPAAGDYAGFGRRNVDRAIAAGLVFRPLERTVADTLTWYDDLDAGRREQITARAGLGPEREAEVLAALREASRG
jgi:2'-hydroxyisoflavone reductase